MTQGWMTKIENNRQIPSLLAQSWGKTFLSSENFFPFILTFIPLCPDNGFGLRQTNLIYPLCGMKAEAWIMQNDKNPETLYI